MVAQLSRQRKQLQGHFDIDGPGLHAAQQRSPLGAVLALRFAELHEGAVAALLQVDRQVGSRIDTERRRPLAGELEQFRGLGQIQLVWRELFGHAAAGGSVREERAVAADPDFHGRPVFALADQQRAHLAGIDVGLAVLDQRPEALEPVAEVKDPEVFQSPQFAPRDRVELIFELSREFVVGEAGEVLFKQAHHRHGGERRHQRGAAPRRVRARLHQVHDRRPSARAPDSQPLQLADQAPLREALRRLRVAFGSLDGVQRHTIARRELRQQALLRIDGRVSGHGLGRIGLEEPGKLDRLPRCSKPSSARIQQHRRVRTASVGHLAR